MEIDLCRDVVGDDTKATVIKANILNRSNSYLLSPILIGNFSNHPLKESKISRLKKSKISRTYIANQEPWHWLRTIRWSRCFKVKILDVVKAPSGHTCISEIDLI